MAENKKSFIAYSDWNEIFKKLTDDEAGKLSKMIFAYVSDENPEAPDRITELIFEPIKQHLKRDLEKYENIKTKRSEAGKKGGLKSGETRSNQNQNEANEAIASKVQANEAVNDNDNVNGNDNVLLEKETKHFDFLKSESLDDKISEPEERKKVAQKKEIQLPFSSKEFKAQWDLWKVYKKKRHKFQYFDEQSEEKALKELFNLSKQNETTANLILRQSIDKGWKGLFELKTNQQNGPTNQNGFSNPSSAGNYKIPGKTSARQFLAREYSDQLKRSDQGGNITVDVEVVE